ncbi:hypothetical protein [Fodinibius saliphilus]|uniref:hypothetical protein n=1 Tax=Fodinibius saliphilus TaxID=1920650 RepID=UPI001109300D|nr:hypothetical protein [Fodinibius saliphilus]
MSNKTKPRFVIFHNEKELIDVKKDIYILHRHLELVQDQLENELNKIKKIKKELPKKREVKKLEKISRALDENLIKEHETWLKNGVPQIVINPFIVSAWSLYESVIKDFASILQKSKNIEKSIENADGRYFLKKAENYFNKTLKHPLHLTKERNSELRLLNDIRNSIVHHYGKVSALRPKLKTQIQNNKIEGIRSIKENGKLVLSLKFAERGFEVVRNHILTLLNKYQKI